MFNSSVQTQFSCQMLEGENNGICDNFAFIS
jgi:hypothetical protein